MHSMSLDFRFPNDKRSFFATKSVLMCIWATAAATLEQLPLQPPLSTSKRLLHLLMKPDTHAHHPVCSAGFNASEVDLLFTGWGLWFMVYGLWFMVCGLWFMVCGFWFVVYVLWFMVSGL